MRPEKQGVVDELKTRLEGASAVVFTRYTGANAGRMAQLRGALSERNGRYMVVKNRLFARAARAAGLPEELPGFEGQVGVAFADEESSIPVLKALVDFHKETETVELLGGLVGGVPYGAAQLKALSRLPAKPAMRAQVLGTLLGVPRGLVSVLAARLRSVLYVIKARIESQGGAPQVEGDAAQNEGGTPQDEGGAPQDEGSAPQDEGGAPQDEGGTPQDEGGGAEGN